MIIKYKGKVIAREVVVLKSSLEKIRGLLFRPKIKEGQAFLFVFPKEEIWTFHMFFMTYKIDIIWLDKNKRIVEMIRGFKPFRVHRPKKKANYVIEMPYGSIKKYKLKEGKVLEFRE